MVGIRAAHLLAALQGVRPGLPVLPGAGPAATGAAAGLGRAAEGFAARTSRRAAEPAGRAVRPVRVRRRTVEPGERHCSLVRADGRGGRAPPTSGRPREW